MFKLIIIHYPAPTEKEIKFKPSMKLNHNIIYIYIFKTESLDNAMLELWLAKPSWYMSHYTMLSKYGNCTPVLKIKNKLKIGCFYK